MPSHTLLGALLFATLSLTAQTPQTMSVKPPPDGRVDAFYVGHSLSSNIPDMVAAFYKAREHERGQAKFRFKEQSIPGASLEWQWGERDREPAKRCPQEPTFAGLWSDEFAKGGWDALVLIESVPRGADSISTTLEYASKFVTAVLEKSKDTRVFFYEPWHCIHSGTPTGCPYDKLENSKLLWRERVDADAKMWDQLVADLQRAHPKVSITLIPAARALGKLADAMTAGDVPGFKAITECFDDDIHLNNYGKYFVACVHYAVMTERSPVGLPVEIQGRWGQRYWDSADLNGKKWSAPKDPTTLKLQEIAWAAAQRGDAKQATEPGKQSDK